LESPPTRGLKPLADQAKREGKTVYHLNIGQPDIPTPGEFVAGFKEIPRVLAYTPSQGLAETRESLVGYYRNHDIELFEDDIIITVGASEAVVFAVMVTLDPGDQIIIPEPFYPNYKTYARLGGVDIVALGTDVESGFRLPAREAIESLITPRTKAILVANPGNPTGRVYTEEEIASLQKVVLQHDLFLISDEVYREFVYDGSKHVSVLTLDGLEPHAILVDSISKRFSACGARIGALASRNKDVMGAVLKLAQARTSPPTAGQLGLIRFLNSSEYPKKVTEIVEQFRRRRDVLLAALERIPGVTCTRPSGAFYVTVRLPVDDSEAFARWLLADFESNGETVMLAPGAGFYATSGRGHNEVRIAYVLEEEKLLRAVEVLQAGLRAYVTHRKQVATAAE
jgi:aspartate aminotransferase